MYASFRHCSKLLRVESYGGSTQGPINRLPLGGEHGLPLSTSYKQLVYTCSPRHESWVDFTTTDELVPELYFILSDSERVVPNISRLESLY